MSDENELSLPDEAVREIRQRYGTGPPVNPAVERSIRSDAAAHLRAIRRSSTVRPRSTIRWIVAAVATSVACLVLTVRLRDRDPAAPLVADAARADSRGQPADVVAAQRSLALARETLIQGDLDRNGLVDILDAFALARELRTGGTPSSDSDVNQDGQTDQQDVELIAMNAVML